ncbi:MAG: hypothetical protein H0V17_05330 [Deltaproteobacteria bacterium]|nr:hypothetical protein [Deltaproteobacteria bacterium]
MSRPGFVVSLFALVTACGDEPVCPSDVFVAIQTSQVSGDVDAAAPGIQTDIRVRTSLVDGEAVTLEVFSSTNLRLGVSTATVDDTGVAIFEGVTITGPEARIRASVSVECGDASDELVIPVTVSGACTLVFAPAPNANAFYAPALVYNAATDLDPAAGYQATAIVNTEPQTTVEIFENAGAGDQSIGTFDSGDAGIVEIERNLLDGTYSYRAFCSRNQSGSISAPLSIVVDTTPPTCAFDDPSPGTTITPAFDNNLDLSDGIQLLVTAQVIGDDIEDEPTTLTVTPLGGSATAVVTTKIDSDGRAGGFTTLNPPSTPVTFTFEFTALDHAQNECVATEDYIVTFDTCDLVVTAPTAAVTADADDNPANGSQVDITVQGSAECVGQTVTSTCGTNQPSGVVPAGGLLTLRADWCATSPCEQTASCTLSISGASASTSITFDDQGPATSIAIVAPALTCGSTIAFADDIDPSTTGVQATLAVTAAGASSRSLEHTSTAGTSTVPATSDVTVTVRPGLNTFVGIATDALGNTTRTSTCTLSLASLAIEFSPPVADGVVERTDGTVTGNQLTFDLCGTVNTTGAAVSLVIDGTAPVPAVVTGTTWCRTVQLRRSPPLHTIEATAFASGSSASASLTLDVDLSP